ncbi:hypothetical protein ScPMuIL_015301 [Solemya velum]
MGRAYVRLGRGYQTGEEVCQMGEGCIQTGGEGRLGKGVCRLGRGMSRRGRGMSDWGRWYVRLGTGVCQTGGGEYVRLVIGVCLMGTGYVRLGTGVYGRSGRGYVRLGVGMSDWGRGMSDMGLGYVRNGNGGMSDWERWYVQTGDGGMSDWGRGMSDWERWYVNGRVCQMGKGVCRTGRGMSDGTGLSGWERCMSDWGRGMSDWGTRVCQTGDGSMSDVGNGGMVRTGGRLVCRNEGGICRLGTGYGQTGGRCMAILGRGYVRCQTGDEDMPDWGRGMSDWGTVVCQTGDGGCQTGDGGMSDWERWYVRLGTVVCQTRSKVFNAVGPNQKLSLNIRGQISSRHHQNISERTRRSFWCVQKILTYLKNNGQSAHVLRGFRTSEDIGGDTSVQALYGRSGCGVQIGYMPGVTADVLDIAKAVLLFCPAIFEVVQRDLGLIVMADRVHVHMTASWTQHHIALDGYSNVTVEIMDMVEQYTDKGLDPSVIQIVLAVLSLRQMGYPDGVVSAESVVGEVDYPITRTDDEFKRLVQYQGYHHVEFEDTEHLAAWCGTHGNPCVNCVNGTQGNSVNMRCADRVMSTRLRNVIQRLQKLSRNVTGESIRVLEAWDEPYEGMPTGDYGNQSLHTEGRAAIMTSSTLTKHFPLKQLSKLAICAGADFVANRGGHLLLAVKKMKGSAPTTVSFPYTELLVVDVPAPLMAEYQLPAELDDEEEDYPLFDSYVEGDVVLGENARLSQFISPNSRYFRLRPLIVRCYSQVVYHDNKYLKPTDPEVVIDVVRGFLGNTEQRSLYDPLFDKRLNTHLMGEAIYIAYNRNTSEGYNVLRLARNVIDKCGPIFEQENEILAVGIYHEAVYVGIGVDYHFSIWLENERILPGTMNTTEYVRGMEKRYENVIAGRLVDPSDMDEACKLAEPPQRQSLDYEYEHSELLRRSKRMAPGPNECVARGNTKACNDTEPHRKAQVAEIWNIISHKYLSRKDDIEEALTNCFGICGTCLHGSIYEAKVRHCSNFSPLGSVRTRKRSTRHHQLFRPRRHGNSTYMVFLVSLAPSAESLYRPDPTKSIQEDLYDSVENPLPVMRLLTLLYATHASGIVKFWVRDETDLTSMKDTLQVVMLYNSNVTDIHIYVTKAISKKAVSQVAQGFTRDWADSGCPSKARDFLAPFTVMDIPRHLSKRSSGHLPDLKEGMILEKRQELYNGMAP